MNRKCLVILIGVFFCFYGFAIAQEPKYPTKPITIVSGYAPGGGTDITARLIGPQITKAMGQPVIVENRPGASQNIACEYVARAPKDGYILFMSSANLGINLSVYPNLYYDPVKSFAPVALVGTSPNLLLVRNSFPAKSIEEFVAVVKQNPGKFNFGSSGVASTQHLSGELLKLTLNTDITHVPYNGSAASMTALATGEIDFSFTNITSAQAMLGAGKIRALGIASDRRSPMMPELRTMIEAGLPGFVSGAWNGVLVPAGTPDNIIKSLNEVIVKALRTKDFNEQLIKTGLDPVAESPEYFRKYLQSEIDRWAKVAKAAKIKIQ